MTDNSLPVQQLSYEQAFSELETIISIIENSNPSLEESMRLFERGQILTIHCGQLLDQAELRIQNLLDISENDKDSETEEDS